MKFFAFCVSAVVSLVALVSVPFFIQLDTYTAEVSSPVFLDTDQGKTSKFIRVKPDSSAFILGVDDGGNLKMKIADSHVPYFAWATDGDRAIGMTEGEVICIRERGWRNAWFSEYPILISYTSGVCKG